MSSPPESSAVRGLWLGVLAMALFGLTLPMTRLAIGADAAPQLSPWFVTFGRAAFAAGLSVVFLLLTRSPLPARSHWSDLVLATLGNAIGYPLLLAFALRSVSTSHAAVVTALLPLTTAVVAALMLRQRAPLGFWACAAAGTGLVVLFSMLRAARGGHSYVPTAADLWLIGAVVAASIGYVAGARLTPALGAERVICWVTVLMLPISLPVTLWTWPAAAVAPMAWLGFGYVAAVSMWAGFFAWYRALDLGGAVQVSQAGQGLCHRQGQNRVPDDRHRLPAVPRRYRRYPGVLHWRDTAVHRRRPDALVDVGLPQFRLADHPGQSRGRAW
jgi:drug/metabolite transporter (DMT)-like permease